MMNRKFFIDSRNRTVNFIFSAESDIRERIKYCHNNARWNPILKQWIVPISEFSNPRIILIIEEFGFEKITDPRREEDVEMSYEKEEVDYKYLDEMVGFHDFEYKPRKYQKEYLAYALEHKNVINGDDVGLGKTFESILYTEVSRSFPCLVVVPSTVKYNWEKEWNKITKGVREVAVIESKETRKHKNNWDADVIIINYDIVGKKQGTGATIRFPELDREFAMVICDEAHFLKNSKSQRSAAINKIIKKAQRTQLLTGTPTMNKPVELWNLLRLTKIHTKIVKDWMEFIYRYCGGYRGKFGWVTDGATNVLELNYKLRQNGYIRREKFDVLKELPEVIKQVIHVPISNKKEYDRATDDFLEYIRETEGLEAMDSAMEAEHLVRLGKLRRLSIAGKLRAVEKYLKEFKETGQRLLVFGIHSDELKYLSAKFKCPLIAGGATAKKKHDIKEAWIQSNDPFLFGNIESMGTGVDGLQHVCSNMAIIELPWRPSDITQIVGRIHRSGQTVPSNVTYLLSDYNIDIEMWEMLADKEAVTEAVNKGIDVRKGKSGMRNIIKKLLKK